MYLERKDLPPQLQHLHTTGKIRIEPCDAVTIPFDAGTWSGGTRYIYTAVELSTGRAASVTDTFSPPWDASRSYRMVQLKPGFAVAVTGSFCGKPAGLTLHMHPSNAAPLLPAPLLLSAAEQRIIDVTSTYKAAYRKFGLEPETFAYAKAELVRKGLLTAAGAVTVKGRNARSSAY